MYSRKNIFIEVGQYPKSSLGENPELNSIRACPSTPIFRELLSKNLLNQCSSEERAEMTSMIVYPKHYRAQQLIQKKLLKTLSADETKELNEIVSREARSGDLFKYIVF